jgi:hypothetical protein
MINYVSSTHFMGVGTNCSVSSFPTCSLLFIMGSIFYLMHDLLVYINILCVFWRLNVTCWIVTSEMSGDNLKPALLWFSVSRFETATISRPVSNTSVK